MWDPFESRPHRPQPMTEGYDVAQICLNGHEANATTIRMPEKSKPFCSECGERTITVCENCQTAIRGFYWGGGGYRYEIPRHCHQCGKSFPWTERKKEAALELFIELLEMKKDEGDQLQRDLTDISTENPRTQVASIRIKRWIGKAGKEGAGCFAT